MHKVPDLWLLVCLLVYLCAYVFVLFICVSCCWNVPVYQSQGGVIDLAVADCLFLLLFSLSGGRVLGGVPAVMHKVPDPGRRYVKGNNKL